MNDWRWMVRIIAIVLFAIITVGGSGGRFNLLSLALGLWLASETL